MSLATAKRLSDRLSLKGIKNSLDYGSDRKPSKGFTGDSAVIVEFPDARASSKAVYHSVLQEVLKTLNKRGKGVQAKFFHPHEEGEWREFQPGKHNRLAVVFERLKEIKSSLFS